MKLYPENILLYEKKIARRDAEIEQLKNMMKSNEELIERLYLREEIKEAHGDVKLLEEENIKLAKLMDEMKAQDEMKTSKFMCEFESLDMEFMSVCTEFNDVKKTLKAAEEINSNNTALTKDNKALRRMLEECQHDIRRKNGEVMFCVKQTFLSYVQNDQKVGLV